MSENEIFLEIQKILNEIAETKGVALPTLEADSDLLGGQFPIDSLDLASLVTDLEQLTKNDPFRAGFVNFRTAGELARLYAK
ncbi:MAG: hypothetical protein KTR25_06930 [Myxococcales bacterium]|nr:hypothetical protein [Myxococcales bacterium]